MIDLEKIITWIKKEISEISKDFPKIKKESYLVFSSPYGQCKITSSREEIYKEFPKFFMTDENHSSLKKIFKELKDMKGDDSDPTSKTKNEKIQKSANDLLLKLIIANDIQIEF